MPGDEHHGPTVNAGCGPVFDQYRSRPSPLNLPGSVQTQGILVRRGREAFGHALSTLGGRARQGRRPAGRDRGKLLDATEALGGPPGSTVR
ncbi:MAG TPA: hypothetical protein VER10_11445 [Mycobacterium sp.]|nr:hypothetical protein [Mycobacterium sp.]